MVQIYDNLIMEHFPEKHTGPKPGVLSTLFNTESSQAYKRRVAEIREDLIQYFDGLQILKLVVDKYGFSREGARDFMLLNLSRDFDEADDVGKRCIMIHTEKMIKPAIDDLWRTLDSIRESR